MGCFYEEELARGTCCLYQRAPSGVPKPKPLQDSELTKVRITKRSPGLPLWAAAPFRAISPEPLGEGMQ